MTSYKRISCYSILLIVAAMSMLLASCGKKGYPEPQDPSRNFSWKEITAKAAGKCIAFVGEFEGAFKNYDGMRLEISQVNSADDCPTCPFVPVEVHELSPRDTNFNQQNGSVAFSYCPRPAKAYRWRLAGISKFNRLPHATMTDRLLIVDENIDLGM